MVVDRWRQVEKYPRAPLHLKYDEYQRPANAPSDNAVKIVERAQTGND